MDSSQVDRIKRLALQAIVSDDTLMERLVLKGGNAIDLIYGVTSRASLDLDFSMADDFDNETKGQLQGIVEAQLKRAFAEERMHVFDVSFAERPGRLSEDLKGLWGGYRIEFKVIPQEVLSELGNDQESLRRNALQLGDRQTTKYQIDISRHEVCEPKYAKEIAGYTLFVYAPLLLVIEKLRAICQQRPGYHQYVHSARRRARAKDFFDIHAVVTTFDLDLRTDEAKALLRQVFSVKQVPTEYLGQIMDDREFHRDDFQSVRDTVRPGVELHDYDFYFDFVVRLCDSL